MAISDQDDVNYRELLRILGIGAVAALRGRHLTERQKNKIDRIVDGAQARESKKREIRDAAAEAYRRTKHEARKKKAVDKAVARAEKKPGFSWF